MDIVSDVTAIEQGPLLALPGNGMSAQNPGPRGSFRRVEAVGENVTRVRVGDEVFGTCDGAFAEHACGPADKFAPKPPSLSFEQAATISACTALQAPSRYRDGVRTHPMIGSPA